MSTCPCSFFTTSVGYCQTSLFVYMYSDIIVMQYCFGACREFE